MDTSSLLKDIDTFKLAVDNSGDHIIITDLEGKIIYANRAVEKITGYSNAEIIGNTPRLWGKQMSKDYYDNLWYTIKERKQQYRGEITNRRKNGDLYYSSVIISPILDANDQLIGFIGTEEDITEYKTTIEKLKKDKDDFERINKYLVNRELRMLELKNEVEVLKKKLNEEYK